MSLLKKGDIYHFLPFLEPSYKVWQSSFPPPFNILAMEYSKIKPIPFPLYNISKA